MIERDDDGTERCSVCGQLRWGWDYTCPRCGADYSAKPYNAPHGDLTGVSPTRASGLSDYRNAAIGLTRAFNAKMEGITRNKGNDPKPKTIEGRLVENLHCGNCAYRVWMGLAWDCHWFGVEDCPAKCNYKREIIGDN